jgi:hypothetical protein
MEAHSLRMTGFSSTDNYTGRDKQLARPNVALTLLFR